MLRARRLARPLRYRVDSWRRWFWTRLFGDRRDRALAGLKMKRCAQTLDGRVLPTRRLR
jgi:hypothetical protein